MPNEDFNIKVVTTADTSGLKQTSAELDDIKKKAAEATAASAKQATDAEAKWATSPLNPKNTPPAPPAPPAGGTNAGVTGSAIAIGTIVTLLTAAVSKWKEFSAEQDRWVDGMIKANEHSRELGLQVADMLDAMKSAERIETEPLQISFDRLKLKVIELKTEMKLAFEAGQYEDVKRYAAALGVVESQIRGVTNALNREKEASEKAAEAADKLAQKNREAAASLLKGAVETASPQTQAVLRNEEAARKAREAGDQKSADQYQKSADQLKASMSQVSRDEYEQLQAFGRKPVGRRAGVGESQSAVDDIELNKLNNDIVQHGGKPVTKEEAARLKSDVLLQDIITELKQQTAIWR